MRTSLLRDRSLDSQDMKDPLPYEESVLSRVTSKQNSRSGHQQAQSRLGGQVSAMSRQECKTPESDGLRVLSFRQIKYQIDSKKDQLRRLQNSYIDKNKKLVSKTRQLNITSINANNC